MQDEPPVDPFLTLLCEGYTAAEAAEIEQYMAQWDASTPHSALQNVLSPFSRKITNNGQYIKY